MTVAREKETIWPLFFPSRGGSDRVTEECFHPDFPAVLPSFPPVPKLACASLGAEDFAESKDHEHKCLCWSPFSPHTFTFTPKIISRHTVTHEHM